ncbi:unnamed protein product [Orchesella dallaii]|uniref:MACPF domain-containing protein n=1 Tax=Orchesella dallaii TaxID=48710 RepID=A0ABP1R6L5_9HEXA
MSRVKIKPWLFGVQIVVTLLSWISFSYSFQNPYHIRKCGELFSQDGFFGVKLEMVDQEFFLNLADNYQVSNGWNTTSSLRVEPGCSMNVCNESHLNGECESLPAGSYGSFQLSLSIGFPIASANCSGQRKCKCSDVFVKMSSCARAYLQGGCNTCNADYIDLRNASVEIARDFVGKVEAFRLRKGCKLKLYSETDFDGIEEIISNETLEGFQGEFRSFQCECNSSEFVPRVRKPRPSTLPPLVDVPHSVKAIKAMLQNPKYNQHIGLKVAIQSRKKKRSPKNAYILVLGTTGSGKSSTINLLFDNPYITKSGDNISSTSDIIEFRLLVPIDELGLGNTQLRVIDTPGLGDNEGTMHDARFLATLDSFLSTHEELNDLKPNAILVFHRFNDDKFDADDSRYVKMLRGIDSFRERLTDDNFSNVIHVLTHYSSVSGSTKRRPTDRINTFRNAIQRCTTFPRPTIITVAENNWAEELLPGINGYFRLPNNEYYPRNLFEQLEFITKNAEDPIGLAVFRSAFRDSQEFNVTMTPFKLTSIEGDMVQRYHRIFSDTYLEINQTEVSQLLEKAWDNELSEELKKKYTNSLQYLQDALHLRHINSKEDVPKTTTEILKLLAALKRNIAARTLLDKAFGIKPPNFPQNPIAGYCYNLFTDAPLPETPFHMEELHESDIGFMVPNFLTCKLDRNSRENLIFAKDQPSDFWDKLRKIRIEGQRFPAIIKATPKLGYNIKTIAFQNGSSVLSAQRTFKRFQFVLNERPNLKQGFVDSVKALPNFNENDNETVTKWNDFFKTYGTHVVRSIDGGGAIEIQLRNKGSLNKEMNKALLSLVNFLEKIISLVGDIETSNEMNETMLKEGIDHILVFSGGNPQYHMKKFTNLSIEGTVDMISNWQKSLKFNPTLFTSEMELIPISQVVKKIGSSYQQEIQRVATIIYDDTLECISKSRPVKTRITSAKSAPVHVQAVSEQAPTPPPPPREDTTLMTQFFMDTQKRIQRLHEEMMSLMAAEKEQSLRCKQVVKLEQDWEKVKASVVVDICKSKNGNFSQYAVTRLKAADHRKISAKMMLDSMDNEKRKCDSVRMGVLTLQQIRKSSGRHDFMKSICRHHKQKGF